MHGCIVYNHSLKSDSYLENIQLFSNQTGLPAISNQEMMFNCFNVPQSPAFDFCIFLDKDITLARILEKNRTRVYNTSEAIEICDNKAYTHVEIEKFIQTPETFIAPLTYFNHEAVASLPYPFVLKECYGSWGAQVHLIKNDKMYHETLKKIGNKPFLIQEYIEANGTDYRLYTIGGKVVSAMQRKNDHDFRANCELGGVASKITPDSDMIQMAEKASEILQLDFGGIDLMRDKEGKLYFVEANSSAQIVQLQKTTGINIPEQIMHHIKKDLDF